jgi:alginate O-acetyltransferase complex protein AlgI
MIFTSPLFCLFVLILLIVYGLLIAIRRIPFSKMSESKHRNVELRLYILLIFSLLFYGAWNPRYLLLLVWVSLVDYFVALRLERNASTRTRKILLMCSLLSSLGILAIFKYLGFVQENVRLLAQFLNLESHFEILRLVLPVGISFYIFQSISYVVDVYRRVIPAEKSYPNYLFFLSFFPQLVAGPIVQAKDFLPQIRILVPFSKIELRLALFLILLGAFKKSVLADHLAVTADFAFQHTADVSREFLWLGLFSYAGQIYCDFSGYTDIAQGTALLFGFKLPENFRMPYLARGFSDFWRRWHISLSSWLRTYLYIPLGGSRSGDLRTYINLMIVMFLGGLWHGASWNFAIWGLGHGTLLCLERFLKGLFVKIKLFEFLGARGIVSFGFDISYRLVTFFSVIILWIFFRSSDFNNSLCYLQGIFAKKGGISLPYTQSLVAYACFFALLVGHIFGQFYFKDNDSIYLKGDDHNQRPVSVIALGVLISLGFIAVVLMSGNSLPFVYFVF